MKKLVLLAVATLVVGLLLGCTAPAATTPSTPTKILTLEMDSKGGANWDSDPEIDGIECYLQPRDFQGQLVSAPGTVSAQLWVVLSVVESTRKGELVQQWSGLQLKASDYDAASGARLRLEYRNYKPPDVQYGILEVTLETSDGKRFTARLNSLILGD